MHFIVATDASFHEQTGAASYGICIYTSQGYVRRSGVYRTPMKSSGIAELTAIANALYLINKLYDLELITERKSLALHVDNIDVCRLLMGELKPRSWKRYKDLDPYKYIMEHLMLFDDVHTQHVKAHTVKDHDSHNQIKLMNHWCDLAAHSALSLRLAEDSMQKVLDNDKREQ